MPYDASTGSTPLVVAVRMGYGHMRAGTALTDALGDELLSCDGPPLADEVEIGVWRRARRLYESATRISSWPVIGAPFRPIVNGLTGIEPLDSPRDLSRPTWAVKKMAKSIREGIGRGLCEVLRESGRSLLATYFAPALAADAAGLDDIHLVVTDTDINRVWAAVDPRRSRIRYCVPSGRARQRLRAYGVRDENIDVTGFPLPPALVARRAENLEARVVRLDPAQPGDPPLVTFAVGGAGAQAGLARQFLPALRPLIEQGTIRLALVAGIRGDVRRSLTSAVDAAGLGGAVEVVHRADMEDYFAAFDALMAETDVLWTKPSELTFFAGLGIPLVLSEPVGVHERYNRRWAVDAGAGLEQPDARRADAWLTEWIRDGRLAEAAQAGATNLPHDGTAQILDSIGARI